MQRWIIPVLFAILGALYSCGSAQKDPVKKSEILFQYGSQQLAEGEYTTALENLLKADGEDPDNPDIMNNLALAYYYKKRPAMAKQLLQKVIKKSPNHSDALNNMGTILMDEGDLDRAEGYFTRVTRHLLFKKQFITHHNLSKIAAARGDLALSREHNEKSLQEFDRYCPALFHRGLLFYREQQWEQASKSFKEAMRGVCYNYVGNHFYRAMSLKRIDRLELAEQILERIKTDFPKSGYMPKVRIELEEIRKIKKSGRYSERKSSWDVPQF